MTDFSPNLLDMDTAAITLVWCMPLCELMINP
jgi:hypothetical protein